MECQNLREQIILYAGGKEPAPAGLKGHLEGCAECRALWEKTARGWSLLGEHAPIEPKADFFAGVRGKLARGSWMRIAGPVAAAAAILLALFFWIPGEQSPTADLSPQGGDVVRLSPEDREIVENLELLENYELLQALEMVDDEYQFMLTEEEDD